MKEGETVKNDEEDGILFFDCLPHGLDLRYPQPIKKVSFYDVWQYYMYSVLHGVIKKDRKDIDFVTDQFFRGNITKVQVMEFFLIDLGNGYCRFNDNFFTVFSMDYWLFETNL